MKKLYVIPAALGILAVSAVAQDEPKVVAEKLAMEKMANQVKVISLRSGVMGKPVKGAPYSGVEISESTQTLADGTRIHNETQRQVFRDSEGRLRRETPGEITIWDPVANTSYLLNPKTQTARKMPMGNFVLTSDRTGNGEVSTFTVRTGPGDGPHVAYAASEAKLKAEIEAGVKAGGAGPGNVMFATGPTVEIMKRMTRREKVKEEPLGK